MIREAVKVEPKYRVRCVNHTGPFGLDVSGTEEKVQYCSVSEAHVALEARLKQDLAELHQRGWNILSEERSFEDQAIEYRYTAEPRSLGAILMYDVEESHHGLLYDADEECEHFLVRNMSGVHCLNCTGWYRAGAQH